MLVTGFVFVSEKGNGICIFGFLFALLYLQVVHTGSLCNTWWNFQRWDLPDLPSIRCLQTAATRQYNPLMQKHIFLMFYYMYWMCSINQRLKTSTDFNKQTFLTHPIKDKYWINPKAKRILSAWHNDVLLTNKPNMEPQDIIDRRSGKFHLHTKSKITHINSQTEYICLTKCNNTRTQ